MQPLSYRLALAFQREKLEQAERRRLVRQLEHDRPRPSRPGALTRILGFSAFRSRKGGVLQTADKNDEDRALV